MIIVSMYAETVHINCVDTACACSVCLVYIYNSTYMQICSDLSLMAVDGRCYVDNKNTVYNLA